MKRFVALLLVIMVISVSTAFASSKDGFLQIDGGLAGVLAKVENPKASTWTSDESASALVCIFIGNDIKSADTSFSSLSGEAGSIIIGTSEYDTNDAVIYFAIRDINDEYAVGSYDLLKNVITYNVTSLHDKASAALLAGLFIGEYCTNYIIISDSAIEEGNLMAYSLFNQ